MLRKKLLVFAPIALALACQSQLQEPTGSTSQAIIGGSADTTHDAVIAQLQDQGLCSGTFIKVDTTTNVGYILTAAHCVTSPPRVVIQGTSVQAPNALQYDVLDYKAHPSYTGAVESDFDIAVVRVAGVDATTPVIPILRPAQDNLSAGKSIVSVGFGKTSPSDTEDLDPIRKKITLTVGNVSSTKLAFAYQNGGTCQGDSGGPVLYTIGGKEYVAGIHSYVVGGCTSGAVSGRVSAAVTFIDQELAKQPVGVKPCDQCQKNLFSGKNVCATAQRECLGDPTCAAYSECLGKCSNAACRSACDKQYPLGVGPLRAIGFCACDNGCKSLCGLSCTSAPKCGIVRSNSKCDTCLDASCCDETNFAADEGLGYQCLTTKGAFAGCSGSKTYQAVLKCQTQKCKDACSDAPAVPNGEGEAEPPSESPNNSTDQGASSGAAAAPSETPGTSADSSGGCQQSPGGRGTGSSLGLLLGLLGVLGLRRRARIHN